MKYLKYSIFTIMFIVPILFWHKNNSNGEKFNYSTLVKCDNIQDIIKIYGQQSIIDQGQYVFEGEPVDDSNKYTILSNTKNQFEIISFKDRIVYSFDTMESDWILPLNLKVGMSLTDLEKINEAPMTFYNLEIDYQTAGMVTDWHNGKLSQLEGIILDGYITPSNTYSFESLDDRLSIESLNSEMSFVKDANLKLGRIELIKLNK